MRLCISDSSRFLQESPQQLCRLFGRLDYLMNRREIPFRCRSYPSSKRTSRLQTLLAESYWDPSTMKIRHVEGRYCKHSVEQTSVRSLLCFHTKLRQELR